MAPMALALILGWWLVAASRAQQPAWVWLRQHEGWTIARYSDKEQDTVEFSFLSTNREHAGTYRCKYQVSDSEDVSEMSDPVELVLTDHSFPPPNISLHPKECVEIGTNVTIQCWNKDYGATFLLHKDGRSALVQRQGSDGAGTASFTFSGVTLADSGTYRCSFRPWHSPFVSSPLGDSVTLEVTPTPAPPGAESHGNLVVAVLRGCAAALVFALGIFFVIDARSLWIRRDESLGRGGM
ncbi:killer cell immunoglobulin-like receptor 3DL1 isoform X2 [Meleagris gallopavo]|uniref:killer cell immunoglobulin-like receptor 3DL1 isoform X2 n=1 Tax=Meleagris gallopavo TaxID=9103 RepID=UPI000549DE05|nr:killer cell immunoglobulin-like receptor 3DL1 isoform X2 [Meleagris gallopavo]